MTDKIRGNVGPVGPPWSVDDLADLHAGVLDQATATELWPQVKADPEAMAILAALDSVGADLTALGQAPAPPMPAHFAARLDAAIGAEADRTFRGGLATAQPPAKVVDLAEARSRKNKRAAWGVGLLTAAAAAVAVTVAVLPGSTDGNPGMAGAAPTTTAPTAPGATQPQDTQPPGSGPLAVKSTDIGAAVGKIGKSKDYGVLKDEAGLTKCVEQNGLDPAKAEPIGVRPVTLDGKPGVMALLTTGDIRMFQVLVVEADCTALFNGPIGGR